MTRLLVLAAFLALEAAPLAAREVAVPLTLDLAFFRQALVAQMFTGPEESVRVWDDGSGCNFLVLRSPEVTGEPGRIRVRSEAAARAGKRVGEAECFTILDWKGTITTFQEPRAGEDRPVVRFAVVDSELHGATGRKGVTGVLWDLVKRYAHPRFEAVAVDLQAPLDELRAVLPLFLPNDDAARTERLLRSISLARVDATTSGLVARLRFDVPEREAGEPTGAPPAPEPTLSPAEIERWEASLQRWDAFLTFVVKQAARDSGVAELRRALFDVLVGGRHDILAALAPSEAGAPDPTRGLFLRAWRELAPALRNLSTGLPGEAALRYLSFVGAADALAAIDELGPESGLDISADGLRRLARTLAPAAEDPLLYDTAVDPELRQLFGFGPPPPFDDVSGEPVSWLVSTAAASTGPPRELLKKLAGWAPTREEVDTYLPLVRDLLDSTVRLVLDERPLESAVRPVYRALVLAAAWQESCWRQYVRIGRELSPIVSPAGSVGLMQVNVRVWRGFYDAGALRKDIGYNARAGGEILHHYFADYAIARREHEQTGSVDNLARATYAAYNAGPGQLTRYRRKNVAPRARRVDEAFARKYRAVKDGNELAVAECYGAGAPGGS